MHDSTELKTPNAHNTWLRLRGFKMESSSMFKSANVVATKNTTNRVSSVCVMSFNIVNTQHVARVMKCHANTSAGNGCCVTGSFSTCSFGKSSGPSKSELTSSGRRFDDEESII